MDASLEVRWALAGCFSEWIDGLQRRASFLFYSNSSESPSPTFAVLNEERNERKRERFENICKTIFKRFVNIII
jgi:hypothetical protein